MQRQSSYCFDELIECAEGNLFGKGNAQLPLPPMLMFDKISQITTKDNAQKSGNITAEMLVKPELWFFDCHFRNDPVMPGCLGLDALWQLLGFYLGWLGYPGKGRALGAGEVKFSGEVTQDSELVTYSVDIHRVVARGFTIGMADATVSCDGKNIYTAKNLKVGLFQQK